MDRKQAWRRGEHLQTKGRERLRLDIDIERRQARSGLVTALHMPCKPVMRNAATQLVGLRSDVMIMQRNANKGGLLK